MDYRKIILYNIVGTVLILLTFTLKGSAATLITVTPCQVRNMLIQPRFGISTKTQELIEVIQAPPLLTQTIQVGICMQNNYTFTDRSSPSSPDQICRQRYTSVEVYSKLSQEKMDSLRSIRNILKLSQDDQRFGESFVKDFVLVEAGCDIFFNYLPYLSPPEGAGRENSPQRPVIGVSNLNSPAMEDNSGGSRQKPQFLQTSPYPNYDILQVEAPTNFKQSFLKPRSMIRDDFFRKKLHLERLKDETEDDEVDEANSLEITSPMPEVDHKIDLEKPDQINKEDGLLPSSNKDNIDNPSIASRSSTITSMDSGSDPIYEEATNSETFSTKGVLQEQELKPEDIGLAVLFLDPEFDPIRKLISSVNMNLI